LALKLVLKFQNTPSAAIAVPGIPLPPTCPERKLTNHPRKCLGIRALNQVFFDVDPTLALAS
jgi:hypothetical protein